MLCVVQVRAQNLQELVYKQGSAGITKATVSIVFHNNDPANGPSGYEDKEYITVTRQVGGWGVGPPVCGWGGPGWGGKQQLHDSTRATWWRYRLSSTAAQAQARTGGANTGTACSCTQCQAA